MKRISFDEAKIAAVLKHSSKGDQPKWKYRNKWYKVDSFGYESLAEVVISRLLQGKFESLKYDPVEIEYNGDVRMGSVSNNFLNEKDELYTLERLHMIFCGASLGSRIDDFATTEERISYTVDFIRDITKIDNAGETLTAWLELDAMFLNEDRHTNNIAFIRDMEYNWRWVPYFDNGLSMLSDVKAYPIDISFDINSRKIKSKPFSTSFSKQVKAAEKLYGKQLSLSFSETEIDKSLKDLKDYYDERYIERVRKLLHRHLIQN